MRLISVTEENWMDGASLSVKEEQKGYVAPVIGILARGYDKSVRNPAIEINPREVQA